MDQRHKGLDDRAGFGRRAARRPDRARNRPCDSGGGHHPDVRGRPRHGLLGCQRDRIAAAGGTHGRQLQVARHPDRGRCESRRQGDDGTGAGTDRLVDAAGRPRSGAGVARVCRGQCPVDAIAANRRAGRATAASSQQRPAELQRHRGVRDCHQPGRCCDGRQRPGEGQHRVRYRSGLRCLFPGQGAVSERPEQAAHGRDQRSVQGQFGIAADHVVA